MAGIDRATGRMVALIVLLIVTAAALHGYVPAAERAGRQPEEETSPAVSALLVAMLAVSLGIVTFAVINRMRNRPIVPNSFGALAPSFHLSRGDKTRLSWRVLLIGLAVISAWVFLMWLLSGLTDPGGRHDVTLGPQQPADVPVTDTEQPPPHPGPRREQPQRKPGRDAVGYLTVTAAGMLLVIAAGSVTTALTRRRRATSSVAADRQAEQPVPAARPESLVRAAELGLAQIEDVSREPRDAIIGCYATMERQLSRVPDAVPQDFDTPSEVLARAIAHNALSADNAKRLVNLFTEARFSSHQMTEDHRADAVQILELVLTELRVVA